MRVRLNLATKPLETHRRFLVFSGAAGVAAGIVFLLLGWHVYSVRKAEAALRTQTEKNQKEIDALVAERNSLDQFFSLQENARLHDRAAYLNTIIDSRSFNWTRMFMDLEKVLPGGVRVFSIEPKQSGAQVSVKLTVGAASDEAKLKLLRAFEQSSVFSQVQLVSVHAPTQEGTGDRVILELTVMYSRT